nr:uncharacterized protein LOC110378333 isoform X3 [Helicoverpa armigera]
MTENIDSEANNLCIPEDAFEQFQAVSMYQEEECIVLQKVATTEPKEPDRGELSHISYDNEVVVTTENEINSTVNDNTDDMDTSIEQKTVAHSNTKTTAKVDDQANNFDQDNGSQKVSRRGRKSKRVTGTDYDGTANNCILLGSVENHSDISVNSEQESPVISSTLPRKRGRKPKVKSDLPESGIDKLHSNISNTPFNSDPENSDIVSSNGKRARGRPRKVSLPTDRDFSSELSGSDNNRLVDPSLPRKRGRPRRQRSDVNIDNQINVETDIPSNDLISSEDLNGTTPIISDSKDNELSYLEKGKQNIESESKIFSDGGSSGNDDISLSNFKSHNNLDENNEDPNSTNTSIDNLPVNDGRSNKKTKSTKKGKGKSRKVHTKTNESVSDFGSIKSDDDVTDELSLSTLKSIQTQSNSSENNNTTEVSTTEDKVIIELTLESSGEVNTPTKRSSKMPVMSDFEYNVDSVIDKECEENANNDLLVEDTSKRPVRRKVPKLRYDEGSDEDPFANVELSDDDEPRRRKGNRYYSDDEYVPGRRGNKDIESTDTEAENELIDEPFSKQKRKKLRKKSDSQSPRKKATGSQPPKDVESDDVEVCLKPAVIAANDDSESHPSKLWGTSNEFENFLAKKIQGTNLQIKKVSAKEPTENKTLEIPVIDPVARKSIEISCQTKLIKTTSTGVQTSPPYDIPMKDNITLTPEQSEKACFFLNSIVKTTSELGTLMTEKSEDFIKKKINTTHVTDTMKMDYCVRKSFLLFKLAKHNLIQMEEDLAKQYEAFLESNNLSSCRQVPNVVVPSAKPASSDSDCEIVEEPIKSSPAPKSKEKPKFNPKTVFLNKELSIKIAKKQPENKKIEIKGRHTVWINDTVMVKKVKPTQSFLAQDSRNKKPPDNKITTKMVSDFFENYYRQKAISICAPYITTDWLHVGTECVCNYFVVKPVEFDNNVTYSESGGVSAARNTSTSEINHASKQISNQTLKCPETLLKLCFRIVNNRMLDKRHLKNVYQQVQNEITDDRHQPVTLFRLCLRVITGRAANTTELSPTPLKMTTPNVMLTVLPLTTLCHQRIVALISKSDEEESKQEHINFEVTRCSTEESNYFIPTCSSKNLVTQPTEIRKQIKSLFSLCVELIQQKQHEMYQVKISTPKSLKSYAFEQVKYLVQRDLMVPLSDTNQYNLDKHIDGITIEGLTINSVNTLSEEAFLNLEQSHMENQNSPDYLDEFDNEDNYEPDFNEPDEHDEVENETNWVSQLQMQELRSCVINTNSDAVEEDPISGVAHIKIEPLDDLPEHAEVHVKLEPCPAPDEMTIIPNVKPEGVEHIDAEPILRRSNSNSYDVDAFESFVNTNKLMYGLHEGDIFTQSGQRIRRQHEPDYEEDDMSMSLLVPQTYEPLSIETAKGSLMESSSDEDSSRNRKAAGKKKPDKRSKGKQNKVDPKTINKETTKEKPNNEVANLTRRMKDRIRQEEKKDDSTDSETENLPLRLRRKKEQEKSKSEKTSSKATESEIQCNNVDSTDQVGDDVGTFTGFTAIDQNEMSTYQKYMKYVYDKIIPENENEIRKADKEKNIPEGPLISDEPVELLECEPTMPIFDNIENEDQPLSQRKSKVTSKKDVISKKDETSTKEEKVLKPTFIDRHGWHCYPLNTEDLKLYQNSCVALEKLPESFVQTYFEYQGITTKNHRDQEIDRLTNLSSLNRSVNLGKCKAKSKRDGLGERSSEVGSRSNSPAHSDRCNELEASEDEGANIDDEVAPPVAPRNSENTLAKNLLMDDNDSDSDAPIKVKQEVSDESLGPKSKSARSKKKEAAAVPESGDLMLTADKMMNKELSLLHAPVVVDDVNETPSKGPVTRNKQKSASKNPPSTSKIKNEEDSSSEEEKQWVSTKEKLLKRMGKKDQSSLDDAKRAKLVSEFIERRGGLPDSHIRSRSTRPRRSAKKFLERQKQLGILSRELFGESSDSMYMLKRSQAQGSLYKGRRNIRKVIDKKSLARSTVVANMEEFERKRRLNAKQTRLRELLGCEEGVNVLVINDEVCLEYDFEENRPVVTVHPFFTKVMKAHQYEGVKFMWDACFESLAEIEAGRPGGGCILAHCMGLGKTLQVLALLHTVLTHPGVNMQRVLVCCPLSTVLNWVDEIHKWIGPVTNEIKVFELSKLKKTYERAYQLEDWYNGGGIFIIGYELFRSLTTLDPYLDDVRPTIVNKIRTALLDPGPDIVVCDEGHLLKNDCSVLAVAMSRVVTKRRIILTGTPMQNNLREYYCMVNFVKPNLLGTYSEYSNRFENPIMNGQHRDSREEDIKLMKARTHILHKVLEGCLQRQEASVLYPYLPKKHEYTVFISLTPCQWDLYKHYLRTYGKQSKQSILKDFHILQKIWSHPQVLHNFHTKTRDRDEKAKLKAMELKEENTAEKIEDDLANEDLEEIKPNVAEDLWWLEYMDGGKMLETLDSSNKFVVVFRILDECIALGDKVLIFSTSLFCLDALEYFLKKIKNWSLGNEYFRLDGSVPAEVRQKWCREFNADNNYKTKLFLVSTRAGCLGLNMTASNRVIIMDTSWNPAHDIQSIFRVYRFGQKKDCYIYRLVAMGTMEQKIYERSVTKQAVACRVVDEQQIDRHYNMAELTELYKFDEGGSSVAGGVAAGVRDVALLRVARHAALHAVHEHDSLLRGSAEQGLPEHERNAAWMQFQQEHATKQYENKLITDIPSVAVKRGSGELQQTPPSVEVKTEDTSPDYNPNEPKPKKGKKTTIVKCHIPIKDVKKETRGRPKKSADPATPSTSTQDTEKSNLDEQQEEVLVEKITDILLKYNFQGKRTKTDISTLVAKVSGIVQRGYVDEADMNDDLTSSIARVLLPQQVAVGAATDLVCESFNNSLATSSPHRDPPGPRTKRKAAIAAGKCIDSIAQDVVINLADDDNDDRDSDFEPENVAITSKGKNKSKNSSASTTFDVDESTLSADESHFSRAKEVVDNVNNFNSLFKNTLNDKPEDKITSAPAPTPTLEPRRIKPKDRKIKIYKKAEKKLEQPKVSEPGPVAKELARDDPSILLSDDDEPIPVLNTTKKSVDIEKPVEKPVDPVVDDEVVPLPMSLLKNQNFINIVAHTYLVGNPMLDEDAATLAAQYSTLKTLNEAQQTGKDVCSGPIYDIAVKVIGKDVLKKMHSVNPKAASASAKDAAVSIEMKHQMIATQRTFEETAKTSKLREEMIKEKMAMHTAQSTSSPLSTPTKPTAATTNTPVVPVGLIKSSSYIASSPSLSAEREQHEECILPNDQDFIISDATPLAPPPAPSAPLQPPPTPTPPKYKPIILNNIVCKPIKALEAPFRVTVGKSSSTTSGTAPKIIIRNFKSPPVVASHVGKARDVFLQAGTEANSAATSLVPDTILPNDGTICLDSDDEDSAVAGVPPSPAGAAPAPPVPVSLTSAQGVALPLPRLSSAPPHVRAARPQASVAQPQLLASLPQMSSTPLPHYIASLPQMSPAPPHYITSLPQNMSSVPAHYITSLPQMSSAPAQVVTTLPQPSAAPGHLLQGSKQQLILRQVGTSSDGEAKYVLMAADSLPLPVLPKNTEPTPNHSSVAPVQSATYSTPADSAKTTPEKKVNICKPGSIIRITKSGAVEIVNQSKNDQPTDTNKKVQLDGGRTSAAAPLKTISVAPKPSAVTLPKKTNQIVDGTPSIDLTNSITSATPKTTVHNSASIDLTCFDTPSSITPKTSTSTSSKPGPSLHKSRQSSSSSSSNSSRAASPDNPLSILKDVIHIKAADYPEKQSKPDPLNQQINPISRIRKQPNISVEHVVAADSKSKVGPAATAGRKLTQVPKDKVPKYLTEAVEKKLKKEMLMKKIMPLLGKDTPKSRITSNVREKTVVSFDSFVNASKLSSTASKSNTKASESKPTTSRAETVDLTNISGTSVKPKTEVKKRQSATVTVTPVKKKKPAPMTLKDFDLDDIDDIIELD